MPYSVRARPHAPVAVPIGWDALSKVKGADQWTIDDTESLIDHAASPEIAGWGFADQTLPEY